ncbi:MAG: hypothetical protein IPM54_45405 [Polyangiaceae bacterium]|nr:hypothetical protein [Polyangiaceae bacterium]
MKRLLFGTGCLVAAGVVSFACSDGTQQNGSGAFAGSGGAGGAQSSSMSASSSSGAGGNAEPPGPSAACVVSDVDSAVTSMSVEPTVLTTIDALTIRVADAQTGHTNVGVDLCTPNGLVQATFGGVDSAMAPFAWHWNAPPLPLGTTQLIFRADPSNTVYRTLMVDVKGGEMPMDGGVDAPPDAPMGPTDLCNPLPGNILAHTTFEEGMNGQAPAYWQVRDPGAPGACLGSGAPDSHVFLTTAAPGCGGNALAVDARGQWDCYAVQIFSDYNTIQEGATYRISTAARSQGNTVNPAAWFHIGAQWLDGNDSVFGDVKNPKPASADLNDYDWQVVWWDVVAPPGARRIVVWLSAHYPGRVDFDNISVVKLN